MDSEKSEIGFEIEDNPLNIAARLKYLWKHKNVFLGFMIIGVSLSFGWKILRKPVQEVYTTVLVVRDTQPALDIQGLFEGLYTDVGHVDLENEIAILSSYSIVQDVFKKLDFKISYFDESSLISRELYTNSQILVEVDKSVPMLTDVKVYVSPINGELFEMTYNTRGGLMENESSGGLENRIAESYDVHKTLKFGEWFSHPRYGKFRIFLKDSYDKDYIDEKEYSFVINNDRTVFKKYHDELLINPLKKSSAIKISLKTKLENKAIDFLTALNEVYINNSLESKGETVSLAIQFIDLQLNKIEQSLLNDQKRLQEFQAKNNLFDFDLIKTEAFTSSKSLEKEMLDLRIQISYFEFLKQTIANDAEDKIMSPSVVGIKDRVLESLIINYTEINESILVMKMSAKPDNPYYKSELSRLENVKELLQKNIDNLIASSKVKLNDISSQLDLKNESLRQLPRSEYELINQKRRLAINDQVYTFLLQKKSELAIYLASMMSDKRVLDQPRTGKKLSLAPIYLYMIGGILGMMGAMVFIFMRDLFENKLQSSDQLMDKVPSIPIIGHVLICPAAQDTLIGKDLDSEFMDTFQAIRLNLKFNNSVLGSKVISVSSVSGGEGKTFVAQNLGFTYASMGKRTLLLACDLRKTEAFSGLESRVDFGLYHLLKKEKDIADVIINSGNDNLDLIIPGEVASNAVAFIEGVDFKNLIEDLKQIYDHIIVDTASVNQAVDWRIIQQYSDQNVFIVRENFTDLSQLSFLERTIAPMNNNFSIVYNGMRARRKKDFSRDLIDLSMGRFRDRKK